MSMIETVARAICQQDEQNGGAPWDYWQGKEAKRVHGDYYERAEAAIKAMLELSVETINAIPMEPTEDRLRYYRAALEAALLKPES